MTQHDTTERETDFNRREFLRGTSFATLMAMMGGVPLHAEDKPKADAPVTAYKTDAPPQNCAIIGCGDWGRKLLDTLALLPNAPVVAICDTYEAKSFVRRVKEAAPKAELFTDYKKALAHPEVQAVFVATPSHLHREITEAALKAGKHVYCEAPLGHTVEDARAIAQAARAAYKVNFQAGLQMRSEPHRQFLLQFIRSGAMGKTIMARAQWHKKQSWRRPAPTPEREQDLNWRLSRTTSSGLMGEIAIHQVDMANLFINARPVSVSGFGGVLQWDDGRDVPDTVQAVIEYPGGVRLSYDCTLANSFDADYEMFYGTDSAVMIRENKAWMFKEVDSPLLGWEVFARNDTFHRETGIALVANATKLGAKNVKAGEDTIPPNETSLYKALEAFITNSGLVGTGVQDYVDNFGDSEKGVREYLATLTKTKLPAAGYKEGLESAVTAIKANEAILTGQKVIYQKEWFELA